VRILDGIRLRWHPFTKVLLYIQFLLLCLCGGLPSCVIVCFVVFILLAFYKGDKGIVASPILALVLCALAVVIVLPGGSSVEITTASVLSVRVLGVMLSSMILGMITTRRDLQVLGSTFRLSDVGVEIVSALFFFVPIAIGSLENVVRAQRSRGFEFEVASLVRFRTYRILLVPYLANVLQSGFNLWISINLRPLSVESASGNGPVWPQIFVLSSSFLLWLLPDAFNNL